MQWSNRLCLSLIDRYNTNSCQCIFQLRGDCFNHIVTTTNLHSDRRGHLWQGVDAYRHLHAMGHLLLVSTVV